MYEDLDMEQLQVRKYCVEEIAPLLDLCASRDDLDTIIAQSEDPCTLELAVLVKLYRAIRGNTRPQLFEPLQRLLAMITPDNCNKICSVFSMVLLVEPNLRCVLGHLDFKDVRVTAKLLEVGLDRCGPDLFRDEEGLVDLYSRADVEELKTLRQSVLAKLGGPRDEILMAVLQNKDMQTLVCLSDDCLRAGHPELSGFLQSGLLSDVYAERKLALHVLKRYAALDSTDSDDLCNQMENSKMWADFFNLFEALEERQLHLIAPSLVLLEGIAPDIHPMWLVCVYKLMFAHALNPIAFHGLTCLLSGRGGPFFAVAGYVPTAFNKIEDSGGYRESLRALERFVNSCGDQVFVGLLRESLDVCWAPTAAWYYYKTVLSGVRPLPASLIADLVCKLRSLPHRFIREGCLGLVAGYLCKISGTLSFGDFIKCAGCVYVHDGHLLGEAPLKWASETDLIHEVENLSESKILALVRLTGGDEAVLRKLFSIEGVPPRTRDYIVLHLSLSKAEVFDYLSRRIDDVKSDDDFPALMQIISKNVRRNELDDGLLSKCVRVTSRPSDFEPHQVHLAAAVMCADGHLDAGAILGRATTKMHVCFYEFFIRRCCAFGVTKNKEMFEDLLSTRGEDVVLIVFKHLPDIVKSIGTEEEVAQFLAVCYAKLLGLRNPRSVLRQYLACRFDPEEVIHLFTKCEYSACVLAEVLETKSREGADLEPFVNLLVELLLYGDVYNKHRRYKLQLGKIKARRETCEARWRPDAVSEPARCHSTPQNGYLYLNRGTKIKNNYFIRTPTANRLIIIKPSILGSSTTFVWKFGSSPEVKTGTKSGPALEETTIRSKAIATLLNILGGDAPDAKTANAVASVLLEKYKDHFNRRYFADSRIHLLKMRTVQALLLVHARISSEKVASLTEFVMDSFRNESHQTSVKHLLQWLLIRLLSRRGDDFFIDEIAEKIRRTNHARPSTISALVPVLLHTCRGRSEETIRKLLRILLPWTMGPQFKLRLYSQIGIEKLADFSRAASHDSVLNEYGAAIDGVQMILKQSGEKEIHSVLQGDRFFLEVFEPEGHFTLETIYVEIPRLDGVTPTEWELLDLRCFPEHCYVKVSNENESLRRCAFETRAADNSERCEGVACANIQKKIVPRGREIRQPKGDFVLVCSLIESPANLGGLARTCEVYGVKQMVVGDSKAPSSKDFKSLSMSSENWVEIVEVKPEGLGNFLAGAKRRGYVLIGAEQTSESVSLNGFRFPSKSLLVLGNEKEGISPSVIPLLDVCLEIPQFGFVRSLNVHVAGAVFIWEYVKQHLV